VDQEAPQHLEDADVLQQEVLVCAQGPLQGQALLLAVLLLLLLLLFLCLFSLPFSPLSYPLSYLPSVLKWDVD